VLDLRARLWPERWPTADEQLGVVVEALDGLGRRLGSRVRTIEVGAGTAAFSRTIRTAYGEHAQCDLAEPSNDHLATYRRYRLRRVARWLNEIAGEQSYEVVHMAHVLEHLPDVRAAMTSLRGLVDLRGVVFIEVPNCEPPYWDVVHAPDPPHIHFFTPSSLRVLAESNGFTVCSLDTVGSDLATDPGFLLPTTPEVIDDQALAELMSRRTARLHRRAAPARGAPRENIRLVVKPTPAS